MYKSPFVVFVTSYFPTIFLVFLYWLSSLVFDYLIFVSGDCHQARYTCHQKALGNHIGRIGLCEKGWKELKGARLVEIEDLKI